jgi:nucleotide-binding universal stress UspA family protein
MYDAILVATDGSEHAGDAATHALHAAERFDATLHALYVIETRTAYDNAIVNPEEVRENLQEIGEEALSEIRERADRRGVSLVTEIQEGVPADRVLAYCDEEEIDAVYLGERGHSDFKTVLLGSTAETVLAEADIPVTVV